MTSNRMTTMASRWLIAAVFASGVLTLNSPAQSAAATDIAGVYSGSYEGPKGTTKFELSLTAPEGRGKLTGVFTSYLAVNSDAVDYTSDLVGAYREESHGFQLRPGNSRTVPRSNPTVM